MFDALVQAVFEIFGRYIGWTIGGAIGFILGGTIGYLCGRYLIDDACILVILMVMLAPIGAVIGKPRRRKSCPALFFVTLRYAPQLQLGLHHSEILDLNRLPDVPAFRPKVT